MIILGISAFYHDSSAALLVDGIVVAASQEERFSRKKHDNGFPTNAIEYCLIEGNIAISQVDVVVFYEKPFVKFERILTSCIVGFPKTLHMFMEAIPIWLKKKINMRATIKHELKRAFGSFPSEIAFVEHHLSHAALAYVSSGFKEADILVVDAVGEWASTSWITMRSGHFSNLMERRFPDSLGMLYSSATAFLGFKVNSDEYKVMGLAPYGDASSIEVIEFKRKITDNLLSGGNGIDYKLNLSYFRFQYGDMMYNRKKWTKLFGFPPRKERDPISQSHINLAYAFQEVYTDLLADIVKSIPEEDRTPNLCICGGAALNCAANGMIRHTSPYNHIHIPFAPGDCGCAIGAALAYSILVGKMPSPCLTPYTGPSYPDSAIGEIVKRNNLISKVYHEDELAKEVANLLSNGKIIGWFQGRMEMGPRALGNRSILADPRNAKMKDAVNDKIKFRESFRPFAPVVPLDDADKYFDIFEPSPYMMFTSKVKTSDIPAVTHIDNTARVQTVTVGENVLLYNLLKAYGKVTGIPVLLNTSFNVMGEPIVCSPEDAIKTFLNCGLDYLVLGNHLITK